jgi:hypothetical protein
VGFASVEQLGYSATDALGDIPSFGQIVEGRRIDRYDVGFLAEANDP